MTGVDSILQAKQAPALVSGGHAAAVAVVNLMQQTFKAIAPKDIVADFVKVQDQKPAEQAEALWKDLGEDTIKVMADGCICLAQIWDSAWAEGDGDTTIRSLAEIDEASLEKLYQNPNFLPSHTIDTIGPILTRLPGASANAHPSPASAAKAPQRRKRRGAR
jgi:hypothetical protein